MGKRTRKKLTFDGFQGITTEAVRNDIVTKTDEALGHVQDAVADLRAVLGHQMNLFLRGRPIQMDKGWEKFPFAVGTAPVGT